MKLAILTISGALLAACAPYPPYPPGPPAAQSFPPHGPPSADSCGASAHRWLVGRSRAEIPPRPPGAQWRVLAQGDAMTRDLRPNRLNIIYDRYTQRVLEVWCG